jgi:hypothetical protein
MRRYLRTLYVVAAAAAAVLVVSSARAQDAPPLAGLWTLNRSISEMPREMGFNLAWVPTPARGGQSSGGSTGGRGRRGSSGGDPSGSNGAFSIPRESYEEARRVDFLTAEARNPPTRLMIVDAGATVTITNELGQSRALHPTAKEETLEVEGMLIPTTTKRDGDRLIVSYRVQRDREVRYTYSHTDNPSQLIAEVQFFDHGAGDKARRVYDAGTGTATAAAPSRATAAAPPNGQPAPEKFDARPGAELRGLKSLGILVEDLSAPAVACGLNHDAIEAAMTKRLTDGGFTVRRNSDDDTYLYVNVMTNLSNGLCVSRYDAFLYTHATANLSYRDQPVLVQVSLIHRGGIASGAAAVHTPLLMRGLESYADLFVTQIRSANK